VPKALPKIDLDTVKKQIDDAAKPEGLKLKMRNVSVVDKTDDALYTGQTVAVSAEPKARQIAVVSGWVAIKDRILIINAYTDYKDATTFDTLLAHTKDALMTTLKVTPQP
jgi:hypothetical protein